MHKPIEIDVFTGKIKVNSRYFEDKFLYKNLYQRHFFIFLLQGKYKIKTNIHINEKTGQVLPSEILIYVSETKELMSIEIKEERGKLKLSPKFKRMTQTTKIFINKNKRLLAVAFTIVLRILIDIGKKEIIPVKKEIYERIAKETERLKNKYS